MAAQVRWYAGPTIAEVKSDLEAVGLDNPLDGTPSENSTPSFDITEATTSLVAGRQITSNHVRSLCHREWSKG